MTICFSFGHSVETRDLISCLGKAGYLPTDETSLVKKGDFIMTKMTREQAIRTYVERLSGDELVELIQRMAFYDGSFEDCIYYDMEDFDEFLASHTPMEIAQMICFGDHFSPNDEYFCFTAYGNLESADWPDVKTEAEDLKDDIIGHLVNSYSGDTPWETLNDIISADDDARFIDFLKLIEEEEEDR